MFLHSPPSKPTTSAAGLLKRAGTAVKSAAPYAFAPLALAAAQAVMAQTLHVTTCLNRGDCFYGMRRMVAANLRYSF